MIVRVLVAGTLVLALSVLGYVAGRHALAGVYTAYIDLADASITRTAKLEGVRSALALHPTNGEYWQQFASLVGRQNDLAGERRAYERAVVLRPAWPYVWGSVARSLAETGNLDSRLTLAVRQAQTLGPNEISLHYNNAVTAVVFWYQFSQEQQEIVLPSIEFTLRHKRAARKFAQVIDRYNRQPLFCRRFQGLVDYGPVWCHYWKLSDYGDSRQGS